MAYAQDNPMTHFPDNYGENYKSIAFDGTRGENSSNVALYFKGKSSKAYTIWGDTWGDVVVGSIDSKSSEVKTSVLINNKKLSIDKYATTLSISDSGVLTAYVAKCCGVIDIFEAISAESVDDWKKSELSVNLKIKQIAYVGDSLLILAQDGQLYSTSKSGDSWSAVTKIEAPKSESMKVVSNESGVVALLLDGETFNYADGKLSEGIQVDGAIADLALCADGSMSVVYESADKYYMQSESDKKPTLLPLKGQVKEVVMDRESEGTLYYTTVLDSVAEIGKLAKVGKRWVNSEVTLDTPHNNRALVSIDGAAEGDPIQICWIQETTKDAKVNALSAIKVDISQPKITDTTDKEQIKKLMGMVADWQLTYSFVDKTKLDWHWGAFYEGLIEAYEVTGDERYLEEMMNIGEYYDWSLEEDVLHADRLLICDIYAYLYEKTGRKNPEMMKATKWAMDLHTTRKAKVEPQYKGANYKQEWWSWCDALYMAAPSFYTYSNLTGDPAARDFAFNQWNVVADYLYSEEDALFFRDDRYFDAVSSNGGKVFWARGNGWVMGALTRILRDCPKDSEQYAYYEKMYREMCAKFLEIQRPEGLWTVSLLDPEELLRGESSGSGFYGFAFAWGVNNGILDRDVYGPAAKKAWAALSHNVSQFGRLGYVQQVAGSPYPFYEYQAHTYASGAFLQFAHEMLKME